jgi:hypothetical protein
MVPLFALAKKTAVPRFLPYSLRIARSILAPFLVLGIVHTPCFWYNSAMKTCPMCSKHFDDPKHPHKIYCSRTCSGLARQVQYGTADCETCGKTFEKPTLDQRFCSMNCARPSFGWKRGTVETRYTVLCVVCQKPFETVPTSKKQYTCSNVCRAIRKTLPNPPILCAGCGTSFIPKKRTIRYCSRSCGAKFRLKRLRQEKRGGVSMRAVKKARLATGRGCERCGWRIIPDVLEIHHIDRNRKNCLDENLILLCPNCHSIDHFLAKDGQFANNIGHRARPGRPRLIKI